MKTAATQTSNVGFGVTESRAFGVALNAMTFKTLSDQIYSDKILAPIRELSTNAYDAHASVGKAKLPIRIQVPSTDSPEFVVRDFGPGMNHVQMMENYTTYFQSDRGDSNDTCGCYGLGSKSPFAYADMFSVTSFQQGTARNYVAVLGADGPTFNYLGEEPTTEPDGLRVGFALRVTDVQRFLDRMAVFYSFWEVKPEFVDINNAPVAVNIAVLDPVFQGTGWSLIKRPEGLSADIVVVMGGVNYPISRYDVDQNCPHLDQSTKQLALMNYGNLTLVLNVAIGDVDIPPSRETLGWTAHTSESLHNKLTTMYPEMVREAVKQFDKVKTYEEFVQLSQQFKATAVVWGLVQNHKFKTYDITASQASNPSLVAVDFDVPVKYWGVARSAHKLRTYEINLNAFSSYAKRLCLTEDGLELFKSARGTINNSIVMQSYKRWAGGGGGYPRTFMVFSAQPKVVVLNNGKATIPVTEFGYDLDKLPTDVEENLVSYKPVRSGSSSGPRVKRAPTELKMLGLKLLKWVEIRYQTQPKWASEVVHTDQPVAVFDPSTTSMDRCKLLQSVVPGIQIVLVDSTCAHRVPKWLTVEQTLDAEWGKLGIKQLMTATYRSKYRSKYGGYGINREVMAEVLLHIPLARRLMKKSEDELVELLTQLELASRSLASNPQSDQDKVLQRSDMIAAYVADAGRCGAVVHKAVTTKVDHLMALVAELRESNLGQMMLTGNTKVVAIYLSDMTSALKLPKTDLTKSLKVG